MTGPAELPMADLPMADLRCPVGCPIGMGKLLGRAHAAIDPNGVVELACNNCARACRAAGTPCTSVLHRFNLLGELLATHILP